MGDPAGVGPEVLRKALLRPRIHSVCRPVIFGSARFLKHPPQDTRKYLHYVIVDNPSRTAFEGARIPVVELKASQRIHPGRKSASSGRAALSYLDAAVTCALCGDVDALVTGPVSKAAIRQAGVDRFVGHTEYLAEKAGDPAVAMMFYGRRFSVALVTTHISLADVSSSITQQKILDVIHLSHAALMKLGVSRPRVGVAGLNPHAGEDRSFGHEDAEIVTPAVRRTRRKGINAQGPFPADTLFHAAYNGEYDLVVAMYHDQGLAPFKMIAFDTGVNITLGLPFVRTSVGHGTAFDIAGRDRASDRSMVEAIKLAARLAAR
jgi:4-hydroxythreonine-4-phosphate dehydrogenase